MTIRREFDVDIDVSTGVDKTRFGTPAMVYNDERCIIQPHPSGVYVEPVPVDDLTNQAAFDYKYGTEAGFMKVDILNNSTYNQFRSKADVLTAMESDVKWAKFLDPNVVEKLPHIGKHFDLVEKVAPESIDDLADILALIRPAKSGLLRQYLKHKAAVRIDLYRPPANKELNYFKKAHAYSYAAMIICALYAQDNPLGITLR